MKKSFLLLMAGALAAIANGQVAQKSVIFNNASYQATQPSANPVIVPVTEQTELAPTGRTTVPYSVIHNTHRTTLGGGRWYDYSGLFQFNLDSLTASVGTDDSIAFTGLSIWNDTSSVNGYATSATASAYSHSPWTSYALGFDPFADEWNNATYFSGDIAVAPTNQYVIDSVQINGWYNRSYATAYKRSVVDTLIIAFVQGNPLASSSSASGNMPMEGFGASTLYGVSALNFASVWHDSVNNRAGNAMYATGTYTATATPLTYSTTTGPVYKFLLYSTDTNGSNSNNNTAYPRAATTTYPRLVADPIISYTVAPGNMAAMSVSFKSGDTNYHATHALTVGIGASTIGDTLNYSVGGTTTGYKYGNYTAEWAYSSSDGSTPDAPPYMAAQSDYTMGYFKREGPGDYRDGGWGGQYEPYLSFTAASALQYPLISYHIECATCVTTGTRSLGVKNLVAQNTVNAYPNPATNTLNIAYKLVNSSAVTVTLTNMVGQTVATQKMANATTGTAVFNTAAIPDGMYIYTLVANGNTSTGRVSIAH